MIRTQVYLSRSLYRDIHLLAELKKKPRAKLIRELLREGVSQQRKQKEGSAGDALADLTKIAVKGPVDLSVNLDKYLYEK